LGLSGALAQGLFRNPLADPYLLGSASGATLGVAAALVAFRVSPSAGHWLARLGLTGAAFIGAMVAVLLTLALARGFQHTFRLLLCGIVVGVVLGALCSLTLLLDPQVLQSMQTFMLGSTSYVGWNSVIMMAIGWLVCIVIAVPLGRLLDGLSLGESTAISLGLNIGFLRAVLVCVLALAVGLSVAQTGLIAFVGLASPHLVRSMVKVTHAHLLLISSVMGAALLGAADVLARCLLAPRELPVGVLTAVLGGGYLLWLMQKRQFSSTGGES
jgi:iron complex transport system permease protein